MCFDASEIINRLIELLLHIIKFHGILLTLKAHIEINLFKKPKSKVKTQF